MKRMAAVLACLAAVSCASDAERKMEARQAEVRAAFEAWLDAAAAGDSHATFDMLSVANKSEWLFGLLRDGDSIAATARANLTGTPRTDLDLWLEANRKYTHQRAEILPPSVLGSAWFTKVWDDYFLPDKAAQERMARVEVLQVYVDPTGATLACRNAYGQTELYGLVIEGGAWKVDSYRQSLSQMR